MAQFRSNQELPSHRRAYVAIHLKLEAVIFDQSDNYASSNLIAYKNVKLNVWPILLEISVDACDLICQVFQC